MTRRKIAPWALGFGVAAAGVSLAAASDGLESPVLVMYEKVGMSGREISYTGPVADIDVRYPFHSVAVRSGRWELCTRNDFKGACLDIASGDEIESLKKEFGFFARVRSLRPIAVTTASAEELRPAQPEIIASPKPVAETVEAASADRPREPIASAEAVLRGHSAHFFKTPMFDGSPIQAEDAGAARAFCRAAGFDAVEFSAGRISGDRRVVGDLLCAEPLGESD